MLFVITTATKVDASPTNHNKPCGLWLVVMVIRPNQPAPSQALAKQSTKPINRPPQPLMRLQSPSVVDTFLKPQVLSCDEWKV